MEFVRGVIAVGGDSNKYSFSFSAMARAMEMAVGMAKGHKVTKNVLKQRPSRRKGVSRKLSLFLLLLAPS